MWSLSGPGALHPRSPRYTITVLAGPAIRVNEAGGPLAPEFSEKNRTVASFPAHPPQRVRGRGSHG